MSQTVTVVFGGPSAEHDISILTGLQCERVLQRAGAQVQCLYWDRGGRWHAVPPQTEARDYLDGAPAKAQRVELKIGAGADDGFQMKAGFRGTKTLDLGSVLLALHGGAGESGGTQALFELLGVPATGSSPAAAALGMDKLAFGALMADAGVPALRREIVSPDFRPSFDGPYIVKPRFGGSSIGIEVVEDYETALALLKSSLHMRAGAVVEPYRDDLWDLNISFTTAPQFKTSLIEKPLRKEGGAIYDYAGKYMGGGADGMTSAPRELPAQIDPALEAQARELARQVQQLTGLTGINRLDFLTDGTDIYVNEVNSIPGAMALYLWPDEDPGRLLLAMVEEAKTANRRMPTASFEEGAALRAAGGISGKLTGLGPQR